MPVYGGKLPPIVMDVLNGIRVTNQKAVSCVVYGNNEIGAALRQLTKILEERGFSVVAASAFIAEHSFSAYFPIAIGRPDEKDILAPEEFGRSVLARAGSNKNVSWKTIEDTTLLSTRLLPKKGPKPVVDHDKCILCGTCAENCPMGILDSATAEYRDAAAAKLCLGCMSCVKRCPEHARSFTIPGGGPWWVC